MDYCWVAPALTILSNHSLPEILLETQRAIDISCVHTKGIRDKKR
jgi:hypothetical protein